MANDGNDWNAPQGEPQKQQQGSDWSAPAHEPPSDQSPQIYESGPPASSGGPGLETNDILAIVVAFLLPGIGQLILGQTVKGLVIFGIALVTCSGGGLIAIASTIDAFLVANAKKKRPVDEWEFFPDFKETFNL